jgi:hypothetical protein
MSRLLNTALDDFRKLKITESAIRSSFQAIEGPSFCFRAQEGANSIVNDLFEHIEIHIIDGFEFWVGVFNDICHPSIVSRAKSCVPMVEDCEFDGTQIAATSVNSRSQLLDLSSEVK